MLKSIIAAVALASLAGTASAEVTRRTADGFVLNYSAHMTETPDQIWTALGHVAFWWSDDHSYYASRNMTMDLRPGGCFCETLPDGGVKHGEVIVAWPDKMLRLNAPLGPLQASAPAAVLTFEWKEEGTDGWSLTATYAVNGPGMGALAEPVDAVLGEQFDNLVVYIRAGSPTEIE